MKLALKAAAAGIALTAALSGPAYAGTCSGASSDSVSFSTSGRSTHCTAAPGGGCVHRGDRCSRSALHHHATSAAGHRLVCAGSHAHPHWKHP
jgi:hypothetical protein